MKRSWLASNLIPALKLHWEFLMIWFYQLPLMLLLFWFCLWQIICLGIIPLGTAAHTGGVQQGSAFRPILFSLSVMPLGSVFDNRSIWCCCFADHIQMYLPHMLKSKSSLQPLLHYVKDIKTWLSLNFLKLESEVIVFGPPGLLDIVIPHLSSHVKRLILLLNLINIICSFFQLRLIPKVKAYLSKGL